MVSDPSRRSTAEKSCFRRDRLASYLKGRLACACTYAELRVTKSELIEKISETLKLPAGKAEAIVNTIFDSMVKALERGEGIEIRGFGSFTVRKYKAYEGRNPRTGETSTAVAVIAQNCQLPTPTEGDWLLVMRAGR